MTESRAVVIVGAGPGGAMTAILTAQQRPRLDILLLDAEAGPKRKPCGEYLSPDGVRILAAAGVEDEVMATGAHPLFGLSLMSPLGAVSADYHPMLGIAPFRPYGIGVRRERFDAVLQTAAGRVAELRRGVRVVGMERRGARWRLRLRDATGERDLDTPLVIGADGRQSLVRRRAGLDAPMRRQRFALVCRANGIPHGRHGEMHLGPFGQVGLAPLGGGEVNLNLLVAEPSRGLLRRRTPATLMAAALRATPTLRARTGSARLGPLLATGSLPQRSSSVVADGVALVGDAAGFCDPFTGEGMCLALQAAELLSTTLIELGDGAPDRVALGGYARAYKRRFGMRRSLAEGLQRCLGRRGIAERLVALVGRQQALSRFLIAVTGDYLPL
jgi:2-polyprenyl-6-methoxyphenol hydroxylase-like FAD-dependent oxidoreductase